MTQEASGPTSIVWLRDDLRLADNPALHAAVERSGPVTIVVILDEVSAEVRPLGGASRWWLHESLRALEREIEKLGGRLILRRGAAETELPRLVEETGASAVFWNRRYGASREIDARLTTSFRERGIEVASFSASLLHEPWEVRTEQGGPYRVFTPFWRAASALTVRDVVPTPQNLPAPPRDLASDDLASWRLHPHQPDWSGGMRDAWTPGEAGAEERLEEFVAEALTNYSRRNEPAVDATSHLSPHLRFGEISAAQVWHRLQEPLDAARRTSASDFLRELGWRDFCWHLAYENPQLATDNIRAEFDAFPWEEADPRELEAWHQGRTGIPLVDAGMRELWTTGGMHNRVRMVAASFLVKNLLIDWRLGEQWFWDTLVDADEANNPANWQWVAGSGADAAPYFRVFNPELQAKKFDAAGRYLDRWVPERDSVGYPAPLVDLASSRHRALDAYARMRAAAR